MDQFEFEIKQSSFKFIKPERTEKLGVYLKNFKDFNLKMFKYLIFFEI